MKTRSLILIGFSSLFFSCISTKSTLQNVDNAAKIVLLNSVNAFEITQVATDENYGFNPDYPVNLFYQNTLNDSINPLRFFNAVTGPSGEKIFYKKTGVCCPFPSKNSVSGAALLDVYEVKWLGQKTPLILYLNRYEKSVLQAPKGFGLKKF